MEIEKRIYKATLEDIRQYVAFCSKGLQHGFKYVMIENNFLNSPESSSEIYIDSFGLDRPYCSATLFGTITPTKTYLIDRDICDRENEYVEYDEFCERLFKYIQEEYRERYL